MQVYEVKKYGVSLYMGMNFTEAEDSFKKASPGETTLYRIVNSKKIPLRKK